MQRRTNDEFLWRRLAVFVVPIGQRNNSRSFSFGGYDVCYRTNGIGYATTSFESLAMIRSRRYTTYSLLNEDSVSLMIMKTVESKCKIDPAGQA